MFQFHSFFKWVAITHHRFANASEVCLQKLMFWCISFQDVVFLTCGKMFQVESCKMAAKFCPKERLVGSCSGQVKMCNLHEDVLKTSMPMCLV